MGQFREKQARSNGERFTDPVATGARRSHANAVLQAPGEVKDLKGIHLFFAFSAGMFYSMDQFVEA